MKHLKISLIALLALCSTLAFAAEEYDEGVEYQKLAKPVPTLNPDKVEVREIFWYQCPHCYDLEPFIKNWAKTKPANVDFIQSPVMFSKRTELGAMQFYTLVELGLLDKLHEALFHAVHKERIRFTKKVFAEWVAKNSDVKAEKVLEIMNSFAMRMHINKATLATHNYEVDGVPTIIVNGKYLTNATLAGSHQDMLKVVNFLVERESKK